MWCHNDTGIFSAIPCSGGVNDEWHFTCICYEVHFFARLLVSIGQGPKSFLSCESVASTFLLGRGTLKIWSQTSFAHSYLRHVKHHWRKVYVNGPSLRNPWASDCKFHHCTTCHCSKMFYMLLPTISRNSSSKRQSCSVNCLYKLIFFMSSFVTSKF